MQLELFCAEETVRRYEERITSHVQREQLARLLASPRCTNRGHRRTAWQAPLDAFSSVNRRKQAHVWCLVTSWRWSAC